MKASSVTPMFPARLDVRFEDGTSGMADLSDLVGRGVMSALSERQVFDQARVTPQGAVEWPGDIDICGDTLYLRVTGKNPEDVYPALR